MKAQTTIGILVASALALTSASAVAQGRHGQGGASPPQRAQVERGQRDFDRDRMRDRDRANDAAMDRKQDRTKGPENGQMTKQREMTQSQQGQMKQNQQGQMTQNQEGQMTQSQQGQMTQNQQGQMTQSQQGQMKQNQQGQMTQNQQGQMTQNQQGQMTQNQQRQMNQQGIYGGELMSEQERNQYREQLRLTDSDPEQQTRFKAQHQEKMQKRAKEKGVELPDPPADGSGD